MKQAIIDYLAIIVLTVATIVIALWLASEVSL